ncbi:MAG: amino acid decarboxylase [Clostridia bacterium]|nr:amino acid decarboxylase [Clostridia bacterium]
MNTPIADFAARYASSGISRLHMPGHKGCAEVPLSLYDLTEISGADNLYMPEGIIAESEKNAALLFGSGRTLYSAEGSTQCVKAMLFLCLKARKASNARPFALAARNAHKSLIYAAALMDFDVDWLYPACEAGSLCACPISAAELEKRLSAYERKPFCVFVTSPDYLGGTQDIGALSAVCRAQGVPLIVDSAHGAYLKFTDEDMHPITLGADMCCDSAHKTLPVITGGAYLHISKRAHPAFAEGAKQAMALFGSTSPSYLILESLDRANAYLASSLPDRIKRCALRTDALKSELKARGWSLYGTEPLKLTLETDGYAVAARLREGGVECEYADADHVVLMFSPYNTDADYARVSAALASPPPHTVLFLPPVRLERALSIREAVFAQSETVSVLDAAGRVCAAPAVSCPPAVPLAVSGEVITPQAARALEAYGITRLEVVAKAQTASN